MSIEDRLQQLIDDAVDYRARYSEVRMICADAIEEIERLREFEFKYQGLCA